MAKPADIRTEADRLLQRFRAVGAERVEADILQPADTLLDLYGEDIRARAYVTADPVRGEQMLRPDFTVPVVQAHMAEGRSPARYCYAGRVFRRQDEPDPNRPAEFIQVGLELLGGANPAEDEAEVFAHIAEALAPLGLQMALGDIGLLTAALEGLDLTEARRAALLRHRWRPKRFRALLDRYAHRTPAPETRTALLARTAQTSVRDILAHEGAHIGLRSPDEIATRVAALQSEAEAPALDPGAVALLDDLLALRGPAPAMLGQLQAMVSDLPALALAVARFEARLEALAARGFAPETLTFEAGYGRTILEYYDGFVFGLYAPGRPDLPPIASGGRYDALTRALGTGDTIPAVGGVIRPGAALSLGGAS